jgi:hypothetical protein
MTYMQSWKSHRLTSHTWLGLNPQIGRPLSSIVGTIIFFYCGRYLWYSFIDQQNFVPPFGKQDGCILDLC